MKNIIAVIVLFFFSFNQGIAQKLNISSPEIGKPLPNFVLNEVHYYKAKKVSLNDLKGQFFILEFWDKFCGACVASFPHINQIQQQFKGKLQIILVGNSSNSGIYHTGENIRQLYERYRIPEKLQLTAAFDSLVSKKFVPSANPHLIWVDNKGIVQAITADGLTDKNIKAFITGQSFEFEDHSLKAELKKIAYKNTDLLLVNGNGGNDTSFLFRSMLTKSNYELTGKHCPLGAAFYPDYQKGVNGRAIFQFASMQPIYLFRCAYTGFSINDINEPAYGKYYFDLIFDIKDTIKLKKYRSMVYDSTYNYSLIMPEANASPLVIQKAMQNDLQNYFGFNASAKDTIMPIWKLVVIDSLKAHQLKTKGDTPPLPIPGPFIKEVCDGCVINVSRTQISFKNGSTALLIRPLYITFDTNLFDYTNLNFNIDIQIDAIRAKREDVLKALRSNGLDIIRGERKMKAIVLSDPETN